MRLVFLLLPFAVSLSNALELGDDLSFQLDLIKHQPCNRGPNAKWTKKLEFESGTDKVGPKLDPVPDRPNCFTIGGKVDVLEDFRGEFSIYLELRNTASKKQVPESCVKQGNDGCGGFGSCLYCNACKTFGDNIGVQAQLLLDGSPIKCADGLSKGTYNNLKLAFCLPKLEEILRTQGLTKETFLQLVRNDDSQSVQKMGIFATVYIFDTDVSKQMQTQTRIESVYRKTKKSFFKNIINKERFPTQEELLRCYFDRMWDRMSGVQNYINISIDGVQEESFYGIRNRDLLVREVKSGVKVESSRPTTGRAVASRCLLEPSIQHDD